MTHRSKDEVIETAAEALQYYADHSTYEDENGCASKNSPIFRDDGIKAREALYRMGLRDTDPQDEG